MEDSIVRYRPLKKGGIKNHFYGKNGISKPVQYKLLNKKQPVSYGKKPTVNFNFKPQEVEKVVNQTPEEFTQMSFNMISQIQSQFQFDQKSNSSVDSSTVTKGLFTQGDELGGDFYLPPSDSPSSSEADSSSESGDVACKKLPVPVLKKQVQTQLQKWLASNKFDSCSSASDVSFLEMVI